MQRHVSIMSLADLLINAKLKIPYCDSHHSRTQTWLHKNIYHILIIGHLILRVLPLFTNILVRVTVIHFVNQYFSNFAQ